MTQLSKVAVIAAIGIATCGAQTLTPVGISPMGDAAAVNPLVAGLTDVALGTNATGTVTDPLYTQTLGGPGTATASADTSIGGDLFGPILAIDGIIRIDAPQYWAGGHPSDEYPWLPVDFSESGTTQTIEPIQPPDWLLVDFQATNTIGMIVIEGRFDNRTDGAYTFQYSTDPPPLTTNSTWTTIGSFGWMPPHYFPGWGTNAASTDDILPRLAFAFPAIPNVTGILLWNQPTNANGIWGCSVQELEVYSPFTKAPVIGVQPQSTNGLVGLSVSLSVVATNGVNFQWYKNGAPVGPNNNEFDISTNAQTTDSGTYYVVVSDSIGSVQSSNAVLSVTLPIIPTLTQSNAVIISYTAVPNYVFTMQASPTLLAPFTTFANWSTTVNGQILTATPITSSDQFFRLIQTTP